MLLSMVNTYVVILIGYHRGDTHCRKGLCLVDLLFGIWFASGDAGHRMVRCCVLCGCVLVVQDPLIGSDWFTLVLVDRISRK